MMRLPIYLVLGLAAVGLAACDTYHQDAFTPEVVVESYLIAGEPLPEIRLSMTAPIRTHYTFDAYAIEDADVVVNLLDGAGAVAESYTYAMGARGIYRPVDPMATVQPLRRYALEVRVPDVSGVVRSETLVPGLFQMVSISADTVVYQSSQRLDAIVTNSEYPGRKSRYLFTIEAQDTVNYDLTPIYADMIENVDGMSKSDLVRNTSGLTSEDDFSRNGDGTLTMQLPWIGIAFFGPNDVIAHALDDNLYDFKRSQMGGSPSPGEMDNLLDHVENGRGIFGSMARDRARVVVMAR